jgi:hypothetical protein
MTRHRSFLRSAWECSPGRSASHPEPNEERPLRHSHAERGNDQGGLNRLGFGGSLLRGDSNC